MAIAPPAPPAGRPLSADSRLLTTRPCHPDRHSVILNPPSVILSAAKNLVPRGKGWPDRVAPVASVAWLRPLLDPAIERTAGTGEALQRVVSGTASNGVHWAPGLAYNGGHTPSRQLGWRTSGGQTLLARRLPEVTR